MTLGLFYRTLAGLLLVDATQAGAQPVHELWHWTAGAGILSSPAIGHDGTVYCGADDGNLYAVAPDGKIRWIFPTGRVVESSPAIGPDGTIYVGSTTGQFFAMNPDGSVRWMFAARSGAATAGLGADGTIYFGSFFGQFYALGNEGGSRWTFNAGGSGFSAPAIGQDGRIYFGSIDGNVYASAPLRSAATERFISVRTTGTSTRWTIMASGNGLSPPADTSSLQQPLIEMAVSIPALTIIRSTRSMRTEQSDGSLSRAGRLSRHQRWRPTARSTSARMMAHFTRFERRTGSPAGALPPAVIFVLPR